MNGGENSKWQKDRQSCYCWAEFSETEDAPGVREISVGWNSVRATLACCICWSRGPGPRRPRFGFGDCMYCPHGCICCCHCWYGTCPELSHQHIVEVVALIVTSSEAISPITPVTTVVVGSLVLSSVWVRNMLRHSESKGRRRVIRVLSDMFCRSLQTRVSSIFF